MIDEQAVQRSQQSGDDLESFVAHHGIHPRFGQTGESDEAGAAKPHGINLVEVDMAAVGQLQAARALLCVEGNMQLGVGNQLAELEEAVSGAEGGKLGGDRLRVNVLRAGED